MADYPLVIQAGDIARHLGIALPLSEDIRYTLEEASLAAQSDVAAYLGRTVVPVTYTQEHCRPTRRGWYLKNYPVASITSYTPETYQDGITPNEMYTVVYVAGLDGANDPELAPIRRFIRLHAMFDPAVQIVFRQARADIATRVMSGSVQGQAATMSDAYPTPGAAAMRSPAAVTAQLSLPGAMPTLQTMDRWRIAKRRVYQRPTMLGEAASWPYDLPAPGTEDMWGGSWVTWW